MIKMFSTEGAARGRTLEFLLDRDAEDHGFSIESTDGLTIRIKSFTICDEVSVDLQVDRLSGKNHGLEILEGCSLRVSRSASLGVNLPLSCSVALPDGKTAVFRIPGVRYAGHA